MKMFAVLTVVALSMQAQVSHAAPVKTRVPAATEATTTNTKSEFNPFHARATDRKFYFGTNIYQISRSIGNASLDVFANDKLAMLVRFQSGSAKETVKHNGVKSRMTVDRTNYGLGVSYFAFGSDAKMNLIASPFLAFGTKKDAIDVSQQMGMGLKLTGSRRIAADIVAEAGVVGAALDASATGDFYAGVGFLF